MTTPGSAANSLDWAGRFRAAMLGGAVGDALGAAARDLSTADLQRWYGPHGLTDYAPAFGRRGQVSDLTQLSAFTLEAVLRTRANAGADGQVLSYVLRNQLRWLHTQSVPWPFAMRRYLHEEPAPTGWLLGRAELYSTRNPGGPALAALGGMAQQPPVDGQGNVQPASAAEGPVDCLVWTAPLAVCAARPDTAFELASALANVFTSASNTRAAAGTHGCVLARVLRGSSLWEAVAQADEQLAVTSVGADTGRFPAAVRQLLHGAMFVSRRQRPLGPGELDVEFDLASGLGELGVALTAVGRTPSFVDAVRAAVNHSVDSAVAGSLAGQLAGALYGPAAIPARWLDELELREVLETLTQDAVDAFGVPRWAQRYTEQRTPMLPHPSGTPGRDERAGADRTMVLPAIPADGPVEPAPAAATLTFDTPPAAGSPNPEFAAEPAGVEPEDVEPEDVESEGVESEGVESEGVESEGVAEFADVEPAGVEPGGVEPEGVEADGAAPVEPQGVEADGAAPVEPEGVEADGAAPVEPEPHVALGAPGREPDGGSDAPPAAVFPPGEALRFPSGGTAEHDVAEVSAWSADFIAQRPTQVETGSVVGAEEGRTRSEPGPDLPAELATPGDSVSENSAREADRAPDTGWLSETDWASDTGWVSEANWAPDTDRASEAGRLSESDGFPDAPAGEVPADMAESGVFPQGTTGFSAEPQRVDDPQCAEGSELPRQDWPGAVHEHESFHDTAAAGELRDSAFSAAEHAVREFWLRSAESEREAPERETPPEETLTGRSEAPETTAPPAAGSARGRHGSAEAAPAHAVPDGRPGAAHSAETGRAETGRAETGRAETGGLDAGRGGEHARSGVREPDAPSLAERVLGSFLGSALGDACGRRPAEEPEVEFGTADSVSVTDVTRSTLFTAEGLIRASVARRTLGEADPLPQLRLAHQRWLHACGVDWSVAAGPFREVVPQPDGWLVDVTGMHVDGGTSSTVLEALIGFGAGGAETPDSRAGDAGAVPRAAPVALLSADPTEVFDLGARAAAFTHGHPDGHLPAGAFAVIVQQGLLGRELDDGVWLALQILETREDSALTSELLKTAVELARAGTAADGARDSLGAGDTGAEALAIAVYTALTGEDVARAVVRAARRSVEPCVTAALCGGILGALRGVGHLPVESLAGLELRAVVQRMALDCVAEFADDDAGALEGEASTTRPDDEDWHERYPVRALGSGAGAPADGAPADGGVAAERPVPASDEPLPARAEPPIAARSSVLEEVAPVSDPAHVRELWDDESPRAEREETSAARAHCAGVAAEDVGAGLDPVAEFSPEPPAVEFGAPGDDVPATPAGSAQHYEESVPRVVLPDEPPAGADEVAEAGPAADERAGLPHRNGPVDTAPPAEEADELGEVPVSASEPAAVDEVAPFSAAIHEHAVVSEDAVFEEAVVSEDAALEEVAGEAEEAGFGGDAAADAPAVADVADGVLAGTATSAAVSSGEHVDFARARAEVAEQGAGQDAGVVENLETAVRDDSEVGAAEVAAPGVAEDVGNGVFEDVENGDAEDVETPGARSATATWVDPNAAPEAQQEQSGEDEGRESAAPLGTAAVEGSPLNPSGASLDRAFIGAGRGAEPAGPTELPNGSAEPAGSAKPERSDGAGRTERLYVGAGPSVSPGADAAASAVGSEHAHTQAEAGQAEAGHADAGHAGDGQGNPAQDNFARGDTAPGGTAPGHAEQGHAEQGNFAQADAGHTGDGHTEAGHVDDALPTPKPARRRINGVVDTTPPEPEE